MSVLEADSGSTHRESKSGAGIGQRDGYGFGGRDDAENLWCVGDLELEDFTIREVVELEQEVHWVDLCVSVQYVRHSKRENERTVAGSIPGLVPGDGGDGAWSIFDSERGTASIG